MRGLVLVLAAAGAPGCRFLPNHAYWIETFGHPQALAIAAWPAGALAIGTDRRLYGYPGPWARPWVGQGPAQELKAIAASQAAVYAILPGGEVARFAQERWTPVPGSVAWGVSQIGATEDDRLLVIVGGKVRLVEGTDLKEGPCAALAGVTVAGTRGGGAYVLDAGGLLHQGDAGGCLLVEAPVRFHRIAATAERIVAVAVDGTLWRRRDGAWVALPAPLKYRPGRAPFATRARDVAVSAHSTFILDDEGTVFVLSDET